MNYLTATSIGLLTFSVISCNKAQPPKETTLDSNKARDLVSTSMEAHGGREKWSNNGQLQFRWTYHMTDKGPTVIRDTLQTVDTSNLNVVHQVVGEATRFGMNGDTAWIHPKGAKFTPPARFWSRTPIYFLGIPFVFNDSNANFEILPEQMVFEGKNYDQVRVTYENSAGDSPDDYYVLLIDPDTKLTRGAYYTVTNKLVAPNGAGPAKFISLDNLKNVNGVLLASGHRTFYMKEGRIANQMRYTDISDVKFLPRGTVDLSIPKDAELQ